MSCASLYPDPEWRFSAHACPQGRRFPTDSPMAMPPHCLCGATLPGDQQGAAAAWGVLAGLEAQTMGADDSVEVKLLLPASASEPLWYYCSL